jgi:hypothetical protein
VVRQLTGIPEKERKKLIKMCDMFLDEIPDKETLSVFQGSKKSHCSL